MRETPRACGCWQYRATAGKWLRPGQHITAVGADDETKCELDPCCLKRADRLIVHSRNSAEDHREIHPLIAQGALTIEDIHGELRDAC
jgi:ornithine cyclodeaminase/alanine dehydrogenase-like protein (mu-crystallin family)